MQFRKIADFYRLGAVLAPPTPVLGGLMHTTCRLDTESGTFAVKLLNPAVMARPGAMENMLRSEEIARALSAVVPAVCALTVDGSPVAEIGGDAVMLYPWISARPLLPPSLTAKHAAVLGDLLGRIHKAALPAEECAAEKPEPADWGALLRLAEEKEKGAPWLPLLRDAAPYLAGLHESACRAEESLASGKILSHRDLDPKNVLWERMNPKIIDWEAAGPIHPDAELTDALLAWADDGRGGFPKEAADAFYEAYRVYRETDDSLREAAFAASYRGPLDWLAYSVRRAAGAESDDPSERKMGESEAQKTLREIALRRDKLAQLAAWAKR